MASRLTAFARHLRHTVAKWSLASSISRRISLLVALIVIGVLTSVAYIQIRSFQQAVDRDLVNAARLGAQSVADDLAAREGSLDPLDVRDMLHDLLDAEPLIDAIAVIEVDQTGQHRIVASTSTEESSEVVNLAGEAIQTKAPASFRTSNLFTFAMPVPRRGGLAVAVSVGTESSLQARKYGLTLALGFALPAILIVTVLTHFTVTRVLEQPLNAILRVMDRTGHGDFHARAEISAKDEFGAIAVGLNHMLDQIEGFNKSLHDQIAEATRDLSLRNEQLRASRSQLLATRETLGRAERIAALGQVAANVAHQAGTPLNLVSGYVQMILDDPATDERTRARLRTVERQIDHVTRALRTMLDQARPPSGFEPVSLGDVLARVRDLSEPKLARSNIRLETSVEGVLPRINADATQLEMALLNLVTNALDAMPGGGVLSITGTGDANRIRIEVSDNGPGLPPQVLDHLFDPWVTTKPKGQGSGLGLAIVREVVRMHGGSIAARNKFPGVVFVIELPVLSAAVTSA
jgi:signal transduction histidine kinase/type II secretory pathway pseudopilin PulG